MILNKIYNYEMLKLRSKIKNKIEYKKKEDINKPISYWIEQELFQNEIIDSLTIILRTNGCYWSKSGGCSMCGYINDTTEENITAENFSNQMNVALNYIKNRTNKLIIKIFTSGSFFDPREIPDDSKNEILNILSKNKNIIKVSFETRPEFVSEEIIKNILKILNNISIEFAYGLETSSDIIRIESINKGFLYSDFIKACHIAKKYNILNKAYLFLKPPFLTE